ncbi:MAG: hypothetical protein C0390_06095 [Syntrophus sp. (in: bacteria)]|nr:hypothetical protein [Syntrophus sp. (in: bacteria)]
MTALAIGKAFSVLFKDFHRWDVGYFRSVAWQWPGSVLHPLNSSLHRIITEVPSSERRSGLPVIEKISFGGALMHFDLAADDNYKGRLFWAESGELIFSKIRLKQGSVAVVASETPRIAVSPEYPVYKIDPAKASPAYLLLVLRSKLFQDLLAGLSHGGSTKTRIHPREFERLVVPLPSIRTQSAIADFWQEAQHAVDTARNQLFEPVRSLNNRLNEVYRNTYTRDVIHSRCFVVDFKDLAAWDVKSGRAASFRLACPSFRPIGDFIEDETELIHPAAEPDKDWPVYGVNNKEGVFLNSHQKGATFNAPYKRIRKDWFFHNPTRCNVGSLGMVPDVPEDAITSPEYQVWRLKQDVPEPLLPGYVACLIQTPFFLELVQFNRVGAVKQRMYTENLMQVRIPYVPVTEQQKYADAREKALTEFTDAKRRLNQARQEVEAMILGTKKA